MAKLVLGFGIGFLVVQVLVLGSYASLTTPAPPIAYIFPSTTATPKKALAVGMDAFDTQEFSGNSVEGDAELAKIIHDAMNKTKASSIAAFLLMPFCPNAISVCFHD